MAETSAIAWTKSTFNPWIGCTRVSPGCDHCYAAVSTPARSLKVEWGAGMPRRRTSAANWRQPLRWNAEAARTGEFWPVFCASLADVFDNEVPPTWRADLFRLIEATPALTWLLLTKRIGNAAEMMFLARGGHLPLLPHVWIGATIVNQEEADRDIPKLLAVPAAKRFVSYEPALGPVDWSDHLDRMPNVGWCSACGFFTNVPQSTCDRDGTRLRPVPVPDWIIAGGESDQPGMKARRFDVDWARSTVRQCKAAGVPVFVKQLGSNFIPQGEQGVGGNTYTWIVKDRAGADPAEWPEDLRVQEFPR